MTDNYNITRKQSVAQNGRNVKSQKAASKSPAKVNSIMTAKTSNSSSARNANRELKSLGLINNNGAGTKIKSKSGNVYTVVGSAAQGRKIVLGKNGQYEVLSHDGVLLKKDYVKKSVSSNNSAKTNNTTPKSTVGTLRKSLNTAKKDFQAQLDDDGWAGDLADGVSVLWGSKNRASVVRKDIKAEEDRIKQLEAAANKSEASFQAKFKQIYGVNYNKAAIDRYNNKPTEENYKKAFGTKFQNIKTRVAEYNESQRTGAEVVKTTAKVSAGIAVGVATGGTGFVAMGVAAAGTAAASVAIEESDRYKITSGGGFRKGTNHKKILKGAVMDGASVLAGGAVGKAASAVVKGTTKAAIAGRAVANAAGDVTVGAAQEYVETGKVTASGAVMNAATSAVGSAVSSGALKDVKDRLVRNFKKSPKINNNPAPQVSNALKNGNSSEISASANGMNTASGTYNEQIAGGLFGKSVPSPVDLTPDSGWQNFKTDGRELTVVNSDGNIYFGRVGDSATRSIKLNPGESKVLGKSPDGLDITLQRDMNGKYCIRHKGVPNQNENSSWMKRLLSGSTTQGTSTANINISDKQIKKKIAADFSVKKSNDPGTVAVSGKIKTATESNTALVHNLGESVNLDNISRYIKSGEVCTVGSGSKQKLYVNNNGTAVELKLSKEKFEELFPKAGFAMVRQQGHNNCWLVSSLNAMTESSSGRAQLYSMLEELPNGDIQVKLPGSTKTTTFPGGKPAACENTLLGEGASPGLEMIHQSVLIRLLKDSGDRVENVGRLNLAKLEDEANALSHTPREAVRLLHGKRDAYIAPSNPDYEAKLENALQSFKPGQDMLTATWMVHERSIVDFNPQTRMVTYHDPYYATVDITCSLDEFKKLSPYLTVVKAKSAVNNAGSINNAMSTQGTSAATSQAAAASQTTSHSASASRASSDAPRPARSSDSGIEIVNRKISAANSQAVSLPIKENIIIGDNIRVRRLDNDNVSFVFEGGKYAKIELPPGASKTFKTPDGKSLTVTHSSNGNITVEPHSDPSPPPPPRKIII